MTTQVVQAAEASVNLPGVLVTEAKAGWKTTEFWVTVLTLIATNINLLPIPDKYQGLVNVVLPAVYALARGLAKAGVPNEVPLPNDLSLNADLSDTSGDKI